MTLGTLLIRADASPSIGSGHVMRCLALAEKWQSAGGDAVFAMAENTPAIERRLSDAHCRISRISGVPGSSADLASTKDVVAAELPAWVVLDGYGFDAKYQLEIAGLGSLLVIDDNGLVDHYSPDLILNQNVPASDAMYTRRLPKTRLLLGPRYALLRNEFAAHRDWKREIPALGQRILVSMGGSDPGNFTPRILLPLAELPIEGLKIRAVVGGSAGNASAVEDIAHRRPGRIEVLRDVRHMAELMAWADLAIIGAGTTCWEMCCLGLPAMLVIAAENQKRSAERLHTLGVAVNAGRAEDIACDPMARRALELLEDQSLRRQMSDRGRKLVDGRGTARVAVLMDKQLQIRAAQDNDCHTLWEWANDPVTRESSFSSEPIPWDSHRQWFERQMTSADARVYLVEDKAGAIGSVRFRTAGPRATLSISVAPERRGRGFGSKVMLLGVEELFHSTSIAAIDAYVKPENERSLDLFRSAGFEESGVNEVEGQRAVQFVMKRWGTGE